MIVLWRLPLNERSRNSLGLALPESNVGTQWLIHLHHDEEGDDNTEGGGNGLFLLVPPDKSPSLNPPSRHDYHHQACRPPRLPNVGHLSPSRPMAGARWHRVNDGINYVHDTSTRRLHCTAALTQSPSPAPRARTRSGSSNDRIWRTYDSTNLSLHHHLHILPPPWLSGWISGFSQHLFPLYRTLVRKDKSIFFFFLLVFLRNCSPPHP